MKVCDLTQSYSATSGGVRSYLHAKQRHVREGDEHEHLLIVPGPSDSVRREGRLTTCTVASPSLPGGGGYRLLLRSDKVLRILRAERPDVVEVHCSYNLPWTALHYRASRPSARVVGVYMTDLPDAYVAPAARWLFGRRLGGAIAWAARRYIRSLYGRMDAAVAISPAMRDRLIAMGLRGVRCVPLGVDPETFHPCHRSAALRADLGVGPGELLLVYAGRLDREKRPALLLDALELLPPELRVRLVLVGDGPQAGELSARAARSGGRVRVLPFVADRARLAELLASADLYLSAMPFETFGLSVVEAQASGLPVVGVAGGAMVDRVPAGGGVGLLGAVDSAAEMAANVAAMVRGGGLREAGARARRMVEDRYSWAATFRSMFELYETLLPAGAGAGARAG